MSESAHSQFEISLCAGSLAAKYQEYLHFLSGIPHGNGVALHSRKGSVLLVVGADLSTDGAGFLLLPIIIIIATDRRSSRGLIVVFVGCIDHNKENQKHHHHHGIRSTGSLRYYYYYGGRRRKHPRITEQWTGSTDFVWTITNDVLVVCLYLCVLVVRVAVSVVVFVECSRRRRAGR